MTNSQPNNSRRQVGVREFRRNLAAYLRLAREGAFIPGHVSGSGARQGWAASARSKVALAARRAARKNLDGAGF